LDCRCYAVRHREERHFQDEDDQASKTVVARMDIPSREQHHYDDHEYRGILRVPRSEVWEGDQREVPIYVLPVWQKPYARSLDSSIWSQFLRARDVSNLET
jgi:hypothetical protein